MRFVFSFFIAIGLFVFAASGSVNAQSVQDFVINDFAASYELTNKHPQGELTVKETIVLNFSGQNRGILRAIPDSYRGKSLNLQVLEVKRDNAVEPYIQYSENNNTVLRIGDADVYITGEHTYEISYRVSNVINFYDNYDEFYWDVNGDQWLQSFENVSINLTTTAQSAQREASCFTGSSGSTETNCTLTERTNGLSAETNSTLRAAQTLTIAQAYEKGYFTPPTWWQRNWKSVLASPAILLQLLVVKGAFRAWQSHGKDYPKRGVTAPYFGRPKGVSVMQAGYVYSNNMQHKYVSATIIDLAIRGYITITEKGSGKKVTHQLTLSKNIDGKNLSEGENKLLTSLFNSKLVGSTIELEKQKYKLRSTFIELQKIADRTTNDKGYYELSPSNVINKSRIHFIEISFASLGGIFMSFIFGIPLLVVTSIASALVVIILMSLMTKRSHQGNMLVEHMDGLKMYLGFSEKDRLAAHDAVEAPLARNAHEPVRDVKFFEKLLPFAVAMGVENSWAKAFEGIYQQPPEWYAGRWSTFTTVALASSVSSTVTAASMSFSSPSSSGGSGSGGGGSAGGGGGGGGGGGW